jgi:tetratricopeptide (TPR) repeat protein
LLTEIIWCPQNEIDEFPQVPSLVEEGETLARDGRCKDAIKIFTNALAIVKHLSNGASDDQLNIAITVSVYLHSRIGQEYCNVNSFQEALISFWEASKALEVSLKRHFKTKNVAHPANAMVHSNLAFACYHLNQGDLSLRCSYASMEMRLDFNDKPGPERADLAISLNNIGVCLITLARPDEAFVYFSAAVSAGIDILGSHHPRIAAILQNLSKIRPLAKQ